MSLLLSAPVLLASLFLNGVNIDGVRGQTFEKCKTVRIDDRGDIHIDCPGYQVEAPVPSTPAQEQAAAPSVPVASAGVGSGQMSKRYWLVTEQTEAGAAQYDVDVFINSKWIRKLKAGEEQIVMEISKLLQPGQNKILFAATKHIESGRRSASPGAYLKVIVGEGDSGGGQVLIDNPLLECKRTAAEIDNVNEEFTVQAR